MWTASKRPEEVSSLALWFGTAGGPAAWLVAILLNIALISAGCSEVAVALRYSVLAVGVFLAITALLVALRNWLITRAAPSASSPDLASKNRFLSITGLASGTASILLFASLVPVVLLVDPCVRPWENT